MAARTVQRLGWVAFVLLLSTVLAAPGCGSESIATAPTRSTTNPGTGAAANPAATRAHLESTLTTMEANSIYRDTIDWVSFRARVMAEASNAQTISELSPAIRLALDLLADTQSYYLTPDGGLIGPSPVGGCEAPGASVSTPPPTVGYVRIESCESCGPISANSQFAESLQRTIRAIDHGGLIGWIVDLRGNFGGSMFAMVAGVGPVLGEGSIGWLVYNNREYEREYRDGAATDFGEVYTRVQTPYALVMPRPKVAVLIDKSVASAGEGVAVSFKGRPDTRFLGAPTCGHHHIQVPFRLSDGAVLHLVASQLADRLKRQYRGPIEPDEFISEPAEALDRAVAWLRTGG